MLDIIESPSPNFTPGQRTPASGAIKYIIVHCTAGLMPGCLNWMCNPLAKVSCHYLITKQGEIHRLVADKHIAWHAGKSSWKKLTSLNSHSLGIELENLNDGEDEYPLAQLLSLTSLLRRLTDQYAIPTENILGHSQITPRKTDPAGLDLQEVRNTL